MKRKGTIIDMFFYSIVFLVFGIVILVAFYVADAAIPELSTMFNESSEASAIMDTAKHGFTLLDYLFVTMYFVMLFVPILFAVLVRTNPVFLVINIILMLIYFLIIPTISNVMLEFWSSDTFAPFAMGGSGSYTFPLMTRMFQYLPLISMAIAIILMITMFTKTRGGAGGY